MAVNNLTVQQDHVEVTTFSVGVTENDVEAVFVEVLQTKPQTTSTASRKTQIVDVARRAGTVTNVFTGPQAPENPYEGMVWIKT